MSFFGLNIAGSALDAYQQAANTTSNNIANVNTPGASRQEVNLVESQPVVGSIGYSTWTGPGTQGTGVTVQSITRIHQDSYDQLFRGASASQNYYSVEQQQLSAIQSSFGEPNNGINTAWTNLQTAISQLASNPTDASTRQGVLSSAQSFVSKLNSVGTAITQSQTTVIGQATNVVNQANALIDKIAALNGQIRASTAIGDNPNTYKDQRDQYVDQLSQLLSTQSSIQSNGSTLVTVGGKALVNDTQAYHLSAPVVGTDSSGNPTLVIGFAGDPNPANPTPVQVGSGQLGGYLDVYNTKLTPYATKLNSFANAAANEINKITSASYDGNGNQGSALFQPIVNTQAISATNIALGITDPAQVPSVLASTSAGSLVTALNAANNTVNTASALIGNVTLFHPANGAGATTGTLTVTVDGVPQTFNYDYGAAGNSTSIDGFVTSFNSAQLGVTASYDTVGQKIVFTRDPNNISLAHRAAQAALGTATSADFTIKDSNVAAGGSSGTPSTSLLEVLGASGLNNVKQDSTNAFGAGDNSGANALIKLFSNNYGIPSLQTTSSTAIAGAGLVTVAPPGGNPQAFAGIGVGQVLTIGAGTAQQENVIVSAVNRNTGTITFTAANAHLVNFSITTAQTQTLGAYYGSLVSQLGTDTQTATTSSTSQQTLASNIDSVRQSIDGINLDEETQNLVKYQNAYSAAAKTLNVVEQLLTTALGLIPGG
ncbi:MAG TPA: flagellar hook-associated protein FlgK [Candidatus Elarobacter sp.]